MWRQFPRQIASDIRRIPGLHIKYWHRGTRGADGDLILSSYELLELLEHLPEDSAFKSAAERGGRWPDWKSMLSECVNEAYRFRALYLHTRYGDDVSFDPAEYEWLDPVSRRERLEAAAVDEAKAAQTEPELADAGWL